MSSDIEDIANRKVIEYCKEHDVLGWSLVQKNAFLAGFRKGREIGRAEGAAEAYKASYDIAKGMDPHVVDIYAGYVKNSELLEALLK